MQRIGIRTRVIAAGAALTIALTGCDAIVLEACGEEPTQGTTEYFDWRDCKSKNTELALGLLLIMIAAIAAGAVVAASNGDGGNGDSGGPPVGV